MIESLYEQMRRIPEDLIETNEAVENWAHWSRDRFKKGHCRSIEHRYRSTEVWQEDEPIIKWDSLAAAALHPIICALPDKSRWILHMHVLHRAPDGYIRRKLWIRRDDLVFEFHRALRMVKNNRKSA